MYICITEIHVLMTKDFSWNPGEQCYIYQNRLVWSCFHARTRQYYRSSFESEDEELGSRQKSPASIKYLNWTLTLLDTFNWWYGMERDVIVQFSKWSPCWVQCLVIGSVGMQWLIGVDSGWKPSHQVLFFFFWFLC